MTLRQKRPRRFPIQVTWTDGSGNHLSYTLAYLDFHAACRDGVRDAEHSGGQLVSLIRMPDDTELDYTT